MLRPRFCITLPLTFLLFPWIAASAAFADDQPSPASADPQAPLIQDPHAAHEHQENHHAHRSEEEELRVTITDSRAPQAASALTVSGGELKMRPRLRPADILEATPGLIAVQHAGGGKANQYFLRGFDVDHGTDIAIQVDGIPVNMVSHGHGQGYADMHFLIPELVSSLDVYKGCYETRYGDFSTAGALHLKLTDHFDESQASLMVGRFGILRGLAITSLEVGERLRLVAAGEAYAQDGPFSRKEDLFRMNGFARATYDLSDSSKVSLSWMSYSGRWNASGQIPEREVKAGRLDRFGFINPAEGGSTQRHSLNLAIEALDHRSHFQANLYFVRYIFKLYSDFTFFLDDPFFGDMIEQTDDRHMLGGQVQARYHHHLGPVRLESTFGLQGRFDSIDNGLYHDYQRERLSVTSLSSIAQSGIGLYASEEARYSDWLRLTAGIRLDRADVSVEDRLDGPGALFNTKTGTQGSTLISPKAAFVLSPLSWMDLFLDIGRGFHSNDARGAVRSQDRARLLTPATGYEVGTRIRPLKPLTLSFSAFRLDLYSEQVYVGDAGTTEPSDASQRLGMEISARYYMSRALFADTDITLTQARYQNGDFVALAPTRTITAGLGFRAPFGTFGSIRVKHVGDRPANEDGSLTAEGFTVVDAQLGHRLGRFELGLDIQNVLNSEWKEVQFATASKLRNETVPVEEIHFVPGYPFTIMGRISAFWK